MSLSTEEKILVEQRVTNDGKSPVVSYLLWFFLGFFGAHRFYLGKTGSAAGQLALGILGIFTSIIGIGLILLIALSIWLFVDLFLIPGIVKAHQEELRAELSAEMSSPEQEDEPSEK